MKITTSQLRKIIKEEIQKTINNRTRRPLSEAVLATSVSDMPSIADNIADMAGTGAGDDFMGVAKAIVLMSLGQYRFRGEVNPTAELQKLLDIAIHDNGLALTGGSSTLAADIAQMYGLDSTY